MGKKPALEDTMRKHYRIAIMGAAGVGKSAIVNQFLYGKFHKDYKKTVEDMHRGEFDMDGTKLTLELLDTAGAYKFPGMRRLAIATSDAFILVYSRENSESFREVTELRDLIHAERETDEVPIVIVANKEDRQTKVCRRELASDPVATESAIANIDWDSTFFTASAKEGINIVAIFVEILKLLSKGRDDLSAVLMKRWLSLSELPSKEKLVRNKVISGSSGQSAGGGARTRVRIFLQYLWAVCCPQCHRCPSWLCDQAIAIEWRFKSRFPALFSYERQPEIYCTIQAYVEMFTLREGIVMYLLKIESCM
ncbi:ras-related protein rap-1b [Plakobranchus ocellatus]|uniref:Ras-related protein rap-1b n=1 Tax=Plakobranchus ocellatus TaxID=259542 RepID=A0AAV4BYR3_9GAST|nr:ras-related protein rap-1b [Plakobranchus ocellatus]